MLSRVTLAPFFATEDDQETPKLPCIHRYRLDSIVLKSSADQDFAMLIIELFIQDGKVYLIDGLGWFWDLANPSSNFLN